MPRGLGFRCEKKLVRNSCQQTKWWMDKKLLKSWCSNSLKAGILYFGPPALSKEENSEAKEKERNLFTSTVVMKPLNWFFARLFLSISSQYLRSSRRLVQRIRPRFKSYWKWEDYNLWWYRLRLPMLTPPLRVQDHWHRVIFCKITKGNSQNFLIAEIVETMLERTILLYDWGRIWGYADSMSRIHTTSRPENIPTERVDSFEYENRPSLGCETLSSRRTLLYWYHDRIHVLRPNNFMRSYCEWCQQVRHRNVRSNPHWKRSTGHEHRETCGKG